jgi:hypothetical protein
VTADDAPRTFDKATKELIVGIGSTADTKDVSSHTARVDLRRPVPILCALVLGAIVAFQVASVWPFTADDSYITLRYARELAAGNGPVFQPGLRAEGCTTFLWMLLLALPHLVSWNAIAFGKWVGTALAFAWIGAAAAFTFRAARAGGANRPGFAAALAATALACLPSVGVHAVSGMETMAFALAVLALAGTCSAAVTDDSGRGAMIAALALTAGLLRPEGHLIAAATAGVTATLLPAGVRGRFLRTLALGWVLPAVLFFVWRWSYYGQPLPLPFYIKMGAAGRLPGLGNVFRFVATSVPMLALAAPVLVRVPRHVRPLLAASITLVAFDLFPEHIMGYHLRYLFPAFGPLAMLAGLGADRWLALAASGARATTPTSASRFAPVLALAIAAVPIAGLANAVTDRRFYAQCLTRAHVALGNDLARLPHGTVALSDCGAIVYLSDWDAVDLVGLNDAHIARTGDRGPGYVFARNPDVLVLTSADSLTFRPFFWNTYETPLLDAATRGGFRTVARYRFHSGYHLWVLMRPGDPRAQALARTTHDARADPR